MASTSSQPIQPGDLRPYLRRCGYDDERLAEGYRFNGSSVPLACFSSQSHDSRSACIVAIETGANIEHEVSAVRETGAPIVFVCGDSHFEWWKQTATSPVRVEVVPNAKIASLFAEHQDHWKPSAVYEAKTRGRLPGHHQLDFVDVGLMPLVESQAGRKLSDLLTRSMKRIEGVLGRDLSKETPGVNNLYKSVFWLVAAKMLRDKEVPRFKTLDLSDIDDVFSRVGRHYGDTDGLPPGGRKWRPAIEAAAELVSKFSHLGNVSTEALAHVYENTGVPKELRKALGIHSTPSALVDYMVWQLWPWISEIPEERRHVFEPACGHAGFLVAMLRQLSQWSSISDGRERHKYLRSHLHGIEIDSFALEVAKLSLTLADIPHGNSWDLKQEDMFEGDTLSRETAGAMVLMANPPYESFTPRERSLYGASSKTKALELVKRTLPQLGPGACFGIVVPAGFLFSDEARAVREDLLAGFEVAEIAVFEDKLFEHGDHEVAVLIGRRRVSKMGQRRVTFRRVRNKGMQAFREEFQFSSTVRADFAEYAAAPSYDMRLPELAVLWAHLRANPKLGDVTTVGQGLIHKGRDLPSGSWTVRPLKRGDQPGFHEIGRDLRIYETPAIAGINLSREVVRRYVHGRPSGRPQVLFNYAPVSRGPWRLKAVYDEKGQAFTSDFVCVRPKNFDGQHKLMVLWAVLNSPIANAFAYSKLGKRHNIVGTMRQVPLPQDLAVHAAAIAQAALDYRRLAIAEGAAFGKSSSVAALRQALLAMDAAVLRAYNLPPKLERELLDFFDGEERPGVGMPFTGYFPPDMKAFVPLQEFISPEYQRSTAAALKALHRPTGDKRILKALRTASESFGEE